MKGKRRSLDTFGRGFVTAAELAVVILVAGSALVAVIVPRLAGATPYAVMTGSMRPAMPPGTLVVSRPPPEGVLDVGSVVTYVPRPDSDEVVTHRVVAVGFDAHGTPVYRTQGDDNEAVDPDPVKAGQVVGVRWYFVPYLGYVTNLLTGEQRAIGRYLVAGGLLLYALVMFGGALLERSRRPRRDELVDRLSGELPGEMQHA